MNKSDKQYLAALICVFIFSIFGFLLVACSSESLSDSLHGIVTVLIMSFGVGIMAGVHPFEN